MGAVESVVIAVAVGVVGTVKAFQAAFENHEIRDNLVFEETHVASNETKGATTVTATTGRNRTDEWGQDTRRLSAVVEARAAERQLREGIRPMILPTMAQVEATKERLQYKGLFHFAVVGIAGSDKSSVVNAFRGLRNNSPG